jgi:predicted DNA-binding transcriptional regulator AlpA
MKTANVERILVSANEVAIMLGMSKRQLHRLVTAGDFPPPIPTGARMRRWRKLDVVDWIDQRAASR